MEKVIIFIISGKSGVGKDTTANIIKNYADNNELKCINLQFSFYIKMYAKLITNWDGIDENKPRTLLQDLGNEIREKLNPDFFINRIIYDIKILSKYADIITISDTRFPNELDIISKNFKNSYKIRVLRPNYENKLSKSQKNDLTETALDNYIDYDYVINNDGSLDILKEKIEEIIKATIK